MKISSKYFIYYIFNKNYLYFLKMNCFRKNQEIQEEKEEEKSVIKLNELSYLSKLNFTNSSFFFLTSKFYVHYFFVKFLYFLSNKI